MLSLCRSPGFREDFFNWPLQSFANAAYDDQLENGIHSFDLLPFYCLNPTATCQKLGTSLLKSIFA